MLSSSPFLDEYLPYLLRRADQSLSEPFYNVLMTYQVGRSEWRVLAVLEELGEMTVAELASAALSPQPTVTHAVRRLETRGLITRTPGVDDKRQRFISTTPAGSTLTKTLIREARLLEAEALESLGDLSDLVAQLRALTKLVEQDPVAGDSAITSEAS